MSKLLKYELRKTRSIKLFFLIFTGIFETIYLLAFAGGFQSGQLTVIGVLGLCLTAVFGCLICGLKSIDLLHRELNSKQSYMLFLTPHTSHQILGAKVLENGLSLMIAGGFYVLLTALDFCLLLIGVEGGAYFSKFMSVSLSWSAVVTIIKIALYILLDWFCLVTAAYLAVIVQATLFNGRKGATLLSFLIFVAIGIFSASVTNIWSLLWHREE